MSDTAQVRNKLVVSYQRSFHKKIINYKRKNDKFNVDEPDKHQIKQMITVSITNSGVGRHHLPSGLILRRAQHHLCDTPVKSDMTVYGHANLNEPDPV